jgi:hypothetical protein
MLAERARSAVSCHDRLFLKRFHANVSWARSELKGFQHWTASAIGDGSAGPGVL